MKMTYLDLSTSHLTQQTMRQLENIAQPQETRAAMLQIAGWPAMTVASYDHGVFVTVPLEAESEQWDALPKDLLDICNHIELLPETITLMRFDKDADVIEDLPVYEW